ncbi:MAG: homocysteine S-methyltransferase family protein [Kiloniellales bacterium]|nr:homocysteine S-methyltransferase family protein [Kiloniellales bacterium]
MGDYRGLAERFANKEVVILDGAVGTQLQAMGVPMNGHAWAAEALVSHPYTVRRMHENYIAAGCDVITVNTYASARHNLEPLGQADLTHELNLRAVMLAEDARDRAAKERPVWIAGSVSNFGLLAANEPYSEEELAKYFGPRSVLSEAQSRANLAEQAEILAEAGVDLLLAEATGSATQRLWVVEACVATGLPVWAGFRCHQRAGDPTVRIGYCSEETLVETAVEVMALGAIGLNIFHTFMTTTEAALPIVRELWDGPLGVYPEAERQDYVDTYRDAAEAQHVSPDDFVAFARRAVAGGVQLVGGCCGIELDHIRPLRDALPSHIA